jgi:hypothetical protein
MREFNGGQASARRPFAYMPVDRRSPQAGAPKAPRLGPSDVELIMLLAVVVALALVSFSLLWLYY